MCRVVILGQHSCACSVLLTTDARQHIVTVSCKQGAVHGKLC